MRRFARAYQIRGKTTFRLSFEGAAHAADQRGAPHRRGRWRLPALMAAFGQKPSVDGSP
jgi:hypothetical protein